MRRIATTLPAIAVLFAAGMSYGGEQAEQEQAGIPEKVVKELSFMVGKWETKSFEKGVQVGSASHERRWAPGEPCLIMTWSSEIKGEKLRATGISGWNAKTKQIIEHWYGSDGSYLAVRYPIDRMTEDAWVGTVRVIDAEGEVSLEKCRLEKGKDKWVFTSIREEDGKKIEMKNLTQKVETAALSPNYDKHKFLERLAGNWKIEAEMDGKKTEGEFSAWWAPGKSCLVWSAKTWSVDDARPVMTNSGMIAWDPGEERVRELAVGSDGSFTTAYFEEKDDKLIITRIGTMIDGTEITTKPVGTYSDNKLVFPGSSWKTKEEEVVRQHGKAVFTRIGEK